MTVEETLKGENDNIEYKADIPPKSENYMRTVVAYANANGGRLVFGVENNTWKISGFNRDEVYQKMDAVTNAIYDSCEPKITPNVGIQEADGRYIIVADIPAGMQRPYCVKSQGMIEGVYLRVSGTTRKAAIYQIQEMTLAARNRSYDSERVKRQLSEDEMNRFCSRLYQHAKELCVNREAQRALKQIGIRQLLSFKAVCEENGIYYATNGYQLLDGKLDEYPDAAVQCAVFKGTTRDIFITRKEFYGCIDEQIESAYAFVLEHIDLGARIDGLVRQDIYELPVRTIREMITNAVCHRSYLCPGKVQVALFDDRLEVTSPGMLDKDLTVEKMKAGISKIRNGVLAKIFVYMNMVEAWGTGIPKIFEESKHYGLREPELQDMGSDFRINLYRKKLETDAYGVVDPQLICVNEGASGYGIITEEDSKAVKDGTKTSASESKAVKNGTKAAAAGTKTESSSMEVSAAGTKTEANGMKAAAAGTKTESNGMKVSAADMEAQEDGTKKTASDIKTESNGTKVKGTDSKTEKNGARLEENRMKTKEEGTVPEKYKIKPGAGSMKTKESAKTEAVCREDSADSRSTHSRMTDEERLLLLIRENETITQVQMSCQTGLSLRTVKRMTVRLQKYGRMIRLGSSRSGKWLVKD